MGLVRKFNIWLDIAHWRPKLRRLSPGHGAGIWPRYKKMDRTARRPLASWAHVGYDICHHWQWTVYNHWTRRYLNAYTDWATSFHLCWEGWETLGEVLPNLPPGSFCLVSFNLDQSMLPVSNFTIPEPPSSLSNTIRQTIVSKMSRSKTVQFFI